jgi:hypothetical protein
VALTKKRFELTFKPRLAEIVYRRPRLITNDPRLVPVPVISSHILQPSVPSRAKDGYGASS